MLFPNFPSPHVHIQSLDSASTPKAFIEREKELGTGAITCTDHGTLACCRHVYDLAKKNKLTPILGVEAYFRDDNCPILKYAGITNVPEYAKYFHITLHAMDQSAYEALVRVLSRVSLTRMERHGSEYKPLFAWADLIELAQYNITFTSGCLVGMVQRHYLLGRPDLAEAYFVKLKEIVRPENLYVELFPHKTDKNWVSGVFIDLKDGRKLRYYAGKKLKINGVEIEAGEAVKKHKAGATLESVKNYRKWDEEFVPGEIVSLKHVEDFIENDCIPGATDSDSQKWTNRAMMELATKYPTPILVSDDAHFATPDEKVVQDVRLMAGGDSWRFYASYHRFTSDEAFGYFKNEMGIDADTFRGWVNNNIAWSQRFKDFKFKDRRDLPTKFYPQDTLAHTMELIKKHGRMSWDKQEYVQRLEAEITMLHMNGTIDLLPYFFIGEEVCELYEKNGWLTGPGRGSAAGLLLSYLLGITHVDPIKYKLSMERFLTLDRIKNGKWPDIDQDLPNRDLLVDPKDPNKGWLRDRFGDCVAQVSTDTLLRLRSSVKDVARVRYGRVLPEIDKLTKEFAMVPQGIEDLDFIFGYEGPGGWEAGSIEWDKALISYAHQYPKDWEIVQKTLGLARQKSRHACAFVIMNEPISNIIPLTKVGEHTVTAYTAKGVEAAGGLKMDFLNIKILNDISDCIKLIQSRASHVPVQGAVPGIRQVPHKGQVYDIWDLPHDQGVFNSICESDTETVFQLNTSGARQLLRNFNRVVDDQGNKALRSIEDLAAFTALDRPGPLDAFVEDEEGGKHNMLIEYAHRAKGQKAVDPIPALNELLPETYGIIVYQEQLQRIFQTIGKTTAVEADDFRVHIGKKMMAEVTKDRDVFMRGAVESVGPAVAEQIWSQMFTFGQYGFNKSHAVCYVTISYACAWLKYHYPLEWWTCVLKNAERNEIDEKFWRHCGHLVDLPDIKKSGDGFEIIGDRIQAPLSLLHGVGETAHEWIVAGRPYNTIHDFVRNEYTRRMVNAKKVLDKKGKERLKLGHSPLHRGVVSALILSGSADGLFSPNTTVLDKMLEYEQAYAEVNGKKIRSVEPEIVKMTSAQRFQIRKQILPAYAEPIIPLIQNADAVSEKENGWYYFYNDELFRFVTPEQYERLCHIPILPCSITVAVAGYIVAERRFKYKGNNEALELTIDHDGSRIVAVKWPNKQTGKLPPALRNVTLEGSIAIVLLSKYREDKPFTIDDIVMVVPPLSKTEPEESP
jgi:DNA-directed DNA polymerase III PolC